MSYKVNVPFQLPKKVVGIYEMMCPKKLQINLTSSGTVPTVRYCFIPIT